MPRIYLWSCLLIVTACIPLRAGEIDSKLVDGIEVYRLSQGKTVVQVAPSAGGNAFSIKVGGIEYLRQPESMDKLPGVGYGNPVLYPMPNRVKGAGFTFDGKRVELKPNAGENFIHGLVNRHVWQVESSQVDDSSATLRMLADFGSGTELHSQFPFAHQLFLSVRVTDGHVRWTYEVDNTNGKQSIPFGFALHPYIRYQGERRETFLTNPATHWMESTQQLPSGKLVPAEELDYPLGQPMSLAGTKFDDVFWGMQADKPTRIEFRDVGRELTIRASKEFTHLVVWTPERPYFGIESQTCSTDAHNLHAAGMQDAAHLQICPPGERMDGWVEYQFTESN